MNLQIQTLSHSALRWRAKLPASFAGHLLPGASPVTASGSFGNLSIQEFKTELYSIRYFQINTIQKLDLRFSMKDPGVLARLILKGNVEESIETSSLPLDKNHFIIRPSPFTNFVASFDKETVCHGFDTLISQQMIDELLQDCPSLAQKFDSGEHTKPNPYSHWADGDILELVNNILHCRYQEDLRRYFFKSRVRDLLFQYLIRSLDPEPGTRQPTDRELNAVYKAEEIIKEDISKHYQIPDLAKKVALNEFDLKSVFKKVFGVGPYEYLVQQRMKKARQLLESGLSVKEAAAQIGYRPTDLTAAFIKFYGFTPSSIKKKP